MHKNTGQEIRAVFLYRYLYYDIEQKGSFLLLKIDASATTLNLFYTKKNPCKDLNQQAMKIFAEQ